MKKELTMPATYDECIELACEHLPEGFELVISLEKGGYSCHLVTPECDDLPLDGGDGLRSDIIEGINIANGFSVD